MSPSDTKLLCYCFQCILYLVSQCLFCLCPGSYSAPPGKVQGAARSSTTRRSHTDLQKTLERLATPKVVSKESSRSGSATPPNANRAPPKTKANLTPKTLGAARLATPSKDEHTKPKPMVARREVIAKVSTSSFSILFYRSSQSPAKYVTGERSMFIFYINSY